MAKIIYKKGMGEHNNLSCIEGIEFDLLNGDKALIYPKYAERKMLSSNQISRWETANETEIEALKVKDTKDRTDELLKIGSPSAEWVSQFWSDEHGRFNLPSLLAAMETQDRKKEIDALAETIEGADLLRDFISNSWSCSHHTTEYCWFAAGDKGFAYGFYLGHSCLVVPTILYR